MIVVEDKTFIIDALKNGNVGVLPSDTVYGLMTSVYNTDAVTRLYALKHRENKPGTIIAASLDQLVELGLKRRYLTAVNAYWPGPISIVIPCGNELAYLHQGKDSLAVRVPSDPYMQSILEHTGPLLTSSANHPGEPTANTMQQAADTFGDEVDFYVDGGDLSGREPSTVIRIVDDAIEILRQGAVHINENGRIA